MSQYRNPDNLPGPTGYSTSFISGTPLPYTHFGSLRIGSESVPHYQELRQHMVRAREGQKTLAVVENRNDIETNLVLYSAKAAAEAGTPIEPRAGTLGKEAAGLLPIDQGLLTNNGGRHSAATAAAHELAHLARM
ncbi:MAG TPA: hypothetical protein VNV63_05530, partial [Nitrospiria bacterium]|nr:hypothetical protein [Nitrospiria bacterium]